MIRNRQAVPDYAWKSPNSVPERQLRIKSLVGEYAETPGGFYAKADVSKWLDRDGLHTLAIFVKNTGTNTGVLATTITLEYL